MVKFCQQLPQPTTEDIDMAYIEIRLMGYVTGSVVLEEEDTPIELTSIDAISQDDETL